MVSTVVSLFRALRVNLVRLDATGISSPAS
jgi:hypothetical protein